MKIHPQSLPAKCLNPTCQRSARTRGLCDTCYQTALVLVNKGTIEWTDLERTGRASPPVRRDSSRKTIKAWLLGALPKPDWHNEPANEDEANAEVLTSEYKARLRKAHASARKQATIKGRPHQEP